MATLKTLFDKLVETENQFGGNHDVESYNSTQISSIELDKVKSFSAEFVYNKFEIDELFNDNANLEQFKIIQNNELIAAKNIADRIPRFNKLTWEPVNFESVGGLELIIRPISKQEIEKLNKLGRVNDLTNFVGGNFINLVLKDSGIDNKLFTIVSSSFSVLKNSQTIQQQLRSEKEQQLVSQVNEIIPIIEKNRIIAENFNREDVRGLTSENIFNPETQTAENNQQIQSLISTVINQFGQDLLSDDLTITDSEYTENKIVDTVKALKNIDFKTIMSNKYAYTLLKNIEQDSTNIFADEISNFSFAYKQLEQNAISSGPQTFELATLEKSISSIENISTSNMCQMQRNAEGELAALDGYKTILRFIGFIIDKSFVDSSGNIKKYDSIAIDKPSINTFRDRNVVYGVTYHYKISQLAELLIPFVQDGQDRFARILVKGDSVATQVETVEKMPPPPPQDFQIVYSNEKRALHLTWARNLSSQRDVAKYLIFKRFSFDEPFILIGIIDFTPPAYERVKQTQNKYLTDVNVKITQEQIETTTFFDIDFDTDTRPIYAIVAADVHELYSNYSTQLQVWIDKLRNNLQLKQVSFSGAPIPYPNFYINNSLFNKAIITDNINKLSLYFTPDAVSVRKPTEQDSLGQKIRVTAFGENNGYKMSLLNIDLGRGETIDIKISDSRGNRKND